MKRFENFVFSVMYTISASFFWYGSLTLIYIPQILIRYWWAILAVGLAFGAGRFV